MIGGSALSAYNQYGAGKAAAAEGRAIQAGKEYEAGQMLVNAGQTRATAQRNAMAVRKQGRLIMSARLARQAAAGQPLDSPGEIDAMADIAQEADYRSRVALYEGDDATRTYQSAANLRRWEGEQAVRAGEIKRRSANMSAGATLLSGIGAATAFSKWGEPSVGGRAAAPWIDPNMTPDWGPYGKSGLRPY